MQLTHTSRLVAAAAIAGAVIAWSFTSSAAVRARESAGRHVLLLFSHESMTYAGFDQPLRTALVQDLSTPVDFYTEYLDLIRFPKERHEQQIVDALRVKYKGRRIDLIVVVSPLAFDFLLGRRDELFGDTPIVFASVNVDRFQGQLPANVTGVAVRRDYKDTLNLALRIHPDARHVVVPVGASTVEKSWLEPLRESFKVYEDRLTFTYLTDLPMRDMVDRLRSLPPHLLILFAPMLYTDAAGNYFRPEDVAAVVSASSNAPVYGTDEPFLGKGIVGGTLYDMASVGVAAGRIGRRILSGEAASRIPIEMMDPNRVAFDARQLARWGIDEARLPPGSAVLFREPSLWTQYRNTVIVTGCIVAGQTAFVVLLLVQRGRRRRAEEALRTSEAALRGSYAEVRELAGRLISAQESERRRIARDLHDDLSQKLALLSIEIEGLAARPAASTAALAEAAHKLAMQTGDIAGDVHRLSHDLHPARLEIIGLVPALDGLCRDLSRQHDLRVEFRKRGMDHPVPTAPALCLFRIAQEALSNVMKHSGSKSATVQISSTRNGVRLRVADRGAGFDATAREAAGLGLRSMRERVNFAGGRISIRSAAGRGTRIVVHLPIEELAADRRAGAA